MKNKKVFILQFIIVGAFLFYWFQLRPAEIRKQCLKQVQAKYGTDMSSRPLEHFQGANNIFRKCLIDHDQAPVLLYSEPKSEPDPVVDQLDTSEIENSIDSLKDTIEQQNADREYEEQRRGWCEAGGGVYYGNGSCITDNN